MTAMATRYRFIPAQRHLDDAGYPEYPQLVALATSRDRFTDPRRISQILTAVHNRGGDWATAVLGFEYPGLHRVSSLCGEILYAADEQNVCPPMPADVLAARHTELDRQSARDAARQAVLDRDTAAWNTVRAQAAVELAVYVSSKGRHRHGFGHHLGHAVPAADVYSGTRTIRTHRAGRALCETEDRSLHLRLEITPRGDAPVTCVNCLKWTPKVRAEHG